MTKFFAVKSKSHLPNGLKWLSLVVLSFVLNNSGLAQGWELSFGGVKEDQGQSVIQTVDGGYVIAGYSESFGSDNDLDVYVVRTDVDGTELWNKVFDEGVMEHAYSIIQTPDNGFLIVGDINMPGEDFDIYLLKISAAGKFIWSKTYGDPDAFDLGRDIVPSADGGYVIIGKTKGTDSGEDDVIVVKVDEDGNEIWTKTYGGDLDDSGNAIINFENGYAFVGNTENSEGANSDIVLSHIDNTGAEVWTRTISTDLAEEGRDLVATNDGGIAIVGYQGFNSDILISKYNASGDSLWTTLIDAFGMGDEGNAIIELNNGDLVITGQTEVSLSNVDILIAKVNASGEDVWFTHIGDSEKADFGQDISNTMDGGYVVAGYNSLLLNFFNDLTLIKTDIQGNVLSNHIEGTVFYDTEPDCPFTLVPDINDIPLEGWIVKVKGATNTYFGTTDEDGFYSILVDTGSYNVSVLPPNSYWSPCVDDFNLPAITEFYETDTVYFPILPVIECPYMEVDLSAEFQNFNPCDDITYNVKYANKGTTLAEGAYIEVVLDEELTFNSASITPDQITGNTLRFDLGDIDLLDNGEFYIYTTVSCNVQNFQASSVQARIYPDTLCVMPSPDWDGSTITVDGICEADSVKFDISNVGDPMMDSLQFIVIEDHVLFNTEPYKFLEMRTISFPANGSTYRIIADQSPGHPGNNLPTVAIEGCGTNEGDSISTGYVSEFPENDQDSYLSIDIQEIQELVGSANPVEMRGYPKGYKSRYITDSTDINYLISFSNVGTDTIKRVVIRDTISNYLDITSIQPGASSHPYELEVYDNGILKITLSDIQLLPDGSAEEALTYGFVKFRIAQKPDNPSGTKINNSAAIFLNYDAPIQTNIVSHEIADFPEVLDTVEIISSTEVIVPGVEIKIYPNPFVEATTFEIMGKEYDRVEITILDLNGRVIRRDSFRGNQFHFYRNLLPQGVFIYKLETEGQLINSGKVLVR